MTEHSVSRLPKPMQDYRTTAAPGRGEDPGLDALAYAVCQTGGHIPNRDRSLPDSCEFHRRMAYGYVRVVEAARPGASTLVIAERDQARSLTAALEAQVADLHELHQSWGNTDAEDLDPQALWEDFEKVLNRAVTDQ